MFMLTLAFLIPVLLQQSFGSIDPCDTSRHQILHGSAFRGTECGSTGVNLCDGFIRDGWFKSINFDENVPREMATECVENFQCGAQFPIWMNGSHPLVKDDIVNREACLVGFHSCCDHVYDIQVKNCSGFYVYHLQQTESCSEAYCFGQGLKCSNPGTTIRSKLANPCIEEHHTKLTDNGGRSASCKINGNTGCDNKLNLDWYTMTNGTSNLQIPDQCVSTFSCGATFPIWLNGTHPSISDVVVNRTACVSGKDSCCEKSYTIQIRNCATFFVYKLQPTTECPERYCFGETETCVQNRERAAPSVGARTCGTVCILVVVPVVVCVSLITVAVLHRIIKSKHWNSISGETDEIQLNKKKQIS